MATVDKAVTFSIGTLLTIGALAWGINQDSVKTSQIMNDRVTQLEMRTQQHDAMLVIHRQRMEGIEGEIKRSLEMINDSASMIKVKLATLGQNLYEIRKDISDIETRLRELERKK